ncbi:MAG: methyltransferase [Methanomicrobiales archaeon]|nr:methyltransferase [Methanomicrobiales archaeon]
MRVRALPAETLPSLGCCEWRDPSRRIHVCGGTAYVPVREGHSFDLQLPERAPYRGRGYQRLGDLLLIHGEMPSEADLHTLAAWERPRGILWIRGIEGEMRTPQAEVLWGECGEVSVTEHGCHYILDPTRVMFACGNREERHRMASFVRQSGREERVADMCAGIGYFTIPMALAGARVHAMELSPAAFFYLQQNIRRNHVDHRVQAAQGDCRELLEGVYDRFVIGHFNSPRFLSCAMAHAERGSVLHLHISRDARAEVVKVLEEHGFAFEIAERRVKKYSPGCWHRVLDVMLR